MELILYEDKDRKQEIDRLTQLVRSHVDTSGPTLKVSDRLAALTNREVPERWRFTFDSRWQLGYQDTDGKLSLREYVLPGEGSRTGASSSRACSCQPT